MSTWTFSPSVRRAAQIPATLWRRTAQPPSFRDHEERVFPLVVACASDLLKAPGWRPPPELVGLDTRYLILADVPTPALTRVPSVFDLRRPEHRMHVTTDRLAVRRLLTAQFRDVPVEGIVDAYVLNRDLVVLLGDVSLRAIPVARVAPLKGMGRGDLAAFEIDEDGSFLFWPAADLHLGVSQLLQAVDPSYLADIETRRLPASVAVGEEIARLRQAHGLAQSEIAGVSERHVRRIERGVSRLTGDSARQFANALGMELGEFLRHVASAAARSGQRRGTASAPSDPRTHQKRKAVRSSS